MAVPSAPTGRIFYYSFDTSTGYTQASFEITQASDAQTYAFDTQRDGGEWTEQFVVSRGTAGSTYIGSVLLARRGSAYRIGVRAVNSDGSSERTVLKTDAGFDTSYTPVDATLSGYARVSASDSLSSFEAKATFECSYDFSTVPKCSMLFAMAWSANSGGVYLWQPIYDSAGNPARVTVSGGPSEWTLSLPSGSRVISSGDTLTVNGYPVTRLAFCQAYPDDDNALNMLVSGSKTVVSLLSATFTPTLTAPNAPTAYAAASVVAMGSDISVSWTGSYPDLSVQTKAQVEITAPDGTVTTADVEGDAASYSFAPDQTGQYRIRVRTYGLYDGYGEWSSYVAVTVEYAPVVTISSPADSEIIENMPVQIAWTASDDTGISSQLLTLTKNGTTVHSATLGSEIRSYALDSSTFVPANNSEYVLTMKVTGGSSLSSTAAVTFKTAWVEPAAPKAVTSYTDALGVSMSVEFGSEEGRPDTSYVTVSRSNTDGTMTLLASSVGDGGLVHDPLPPLNTSFSYVLTAYTAAGATSNATVPAYVESGGMEAFNFESDASACILLGLNATSDASVAHSGESFHFALGPDTPSLPTYYPDDGMDVTGSKSYVVHTLAEYTALRTASRDPSHAMCWYRDAWGHRARVKADWSLGYQAGAYSRWTAGATLSETVWEEPIYG